MLAANRWGLLLAIVTGIIILVFFMQKALNTTEALCMGLLAISIALGYVPRDP